MRVSEVAPAWVYAVVPAGTSIPTAISGVADEPVRMLRLSGLTAAVGTVPAGWAGEQELRQLLADPAWLEQAVTCHHEVIARIAATGPTVPFRLATIYHDDRRARQTLDTRTAELRESLRRVAGRAEWGVRAYRVTPPAGSAAEQPSAATTVITAGRSEPAETIGAQTGAAGVQTGVGAGAAYLLRRRSQLADRERDRVAATTELDRLRAALSAVAVAEHHAPPRVEADPDGAGPVIFNGSYLVDADLTGQFVAVTRQLSAQSDRLRLRLSGPLPPYSFVDNHG